MLGLVVFSIVFGIVLGRMGDKGTPLKAFFETLNEVVMKMVTLVMWYVMHIVINSVVWIETQLTAVRKLQSHSFRKLASNKEHDSSSS